MGRERKRGGRVKPEKNAAYYAGWVPPHNELTSIKYYQAGDEVERRRQGQDFMAGTVFAHGAGVVFPVGDPPDGAERVPPWFVIYVNPDSSTWGPAPALRRLFSLLGRMGAVPLHEASTIATSWSALDDSEEPLIKLKVNVREPAEARGRFEILLLAANYPIAWQYIVNGGLVGITTMDRMERITSRPDANAADGLEACILLGMGSSDVVAHLIDRHGWPNL